MDDLPKQATKNELPKESINLNKMPRYKNGFVPLGYFIAGFCSSMSAMLFLDEWTRSVNFYSIAAIPLYMWLGSIAVGLGVPVMTAQKNNQQNN